MEEYFTKAVQAWKRNFNQFQRLQICYFVLGLASLVIAGLISLLNQSAGHAVLWFSKVCWLAFLANAVLNSFLPQDTKSKTSRPKQK